MGDGIEETEALFGIRSVTQLGQEPLEIVFRGDQTHVGQLPKNL